MMRVLYISWCWCSSWMYRNLWYPLSTKSAVQKFAQPRKFAYIRPTALDTANTREDAICRHCFTYIGSPHGPIQRPKPVRYAQCGCYEITARSETQKLARVRPARCPAWGLGDMALEVAKRAPSTRKCKWGDRWPVLLTNLAQCVWKAV
jgi:hypothetical protein